MESHLPNMNRPRVLTTSLVGLPSPVRLPDLMLSSTPFPLLAFTAKEPNWPTVAHGLPTLRTRGLRRDQFSRVQQEGPRWRKVV
jgi:hypothetical protein